MKSNRLPLLLLFCLAGCSATTPRPTPAIIMSYSPSLVQPPTVTGLVVRVQSMPFAPVAYGPANIWIDTTCITNDSRFRNVFFLGVTTLNGEGSTIALQGRKERPISRTDTNGFTELLRVVKNGTMQTNLSDQLVGTNGFYRVGVLDTTPPTTITATLHVSIDLSANPTNIVNASLIYSPSTNVDLLVSLATNCLNRPMLVEQSVDMTNWTTATSFIYTGQITATNGMTWADEITVTPPKFDPNQWYRVRLP